MIAHFGFFVVELIKDISVCLRTKFLQGLIIFVCTDRFIYFELILKVVKLSLQELITSCDFCEDRVFLLG